MKNNIFLSLIILFLISFFLPTYVYALNPSPCTAVSWNHYTCSDAPSCPNVDITYTEHDPIDPEVLESLTYKITVQEVNADYRVGQFLSHPLVSYEKDFIRSNNQSLQNPLQDITYDNFLPGHINVPDLLNKSAVLVSKKKSLYVKRNFTGSGYADYCGPFIFDILDAPTPTPTISNTIAICSYLVRSDNPDPLKITNTNNVIITGNILPINGQPFPKLLFLPGASPIAGTIYDTSNKLVPPAPRYFDVSPFTNGSGYNFSKNLGQFNDGSYTIKFVVVTNNGSLENLCLPNTFTVNNSGIQPTSVPLPSIPPQCASGPGGATPVCQPPNINGACNACPWAPQASPTPPNPTIILQDLCDNIANPTTNPDENAKCHACIDTPKTPYKPLKPVADKPQRIWTAIGCVPTDVPTILSQYVLGTTGLGIAGGVGFLYFLYGAFLVLTSMGNAEKINEGKEIMMSSVWGILLIIFSIFLLKVVAVQVLRIPGFT